MSMNIQLIIQCDRCRTAEIEYEAVTASQADDPSGLLAFDDWLVTEDGDGIGVWMRHYCPGCKTTVEDEQARAAFDDYQN